MSGQYGELHIMTNHSIKILNLSDQRPKRSDIHKVKREGRTNGQADNYMSTYYHILYEYPGPGFLRFLQET